MTKGGLKAAIVPALSLLIASSCAMPAAATEIDFCGGSNGCEKIEMRNNASVVVTKVTVDQLTCGWKKKTHDQNMLLGDKFSLKVGSRCEYYVAFKTTKGCIGDTATGIGPGDIEAGVKTLILKGACGSLSVQKK